mgnify:CR=1 FL=1|tara:strand:+ start:639 stop:833 length:195 start_codon:yes stop_codon:yes gene_type:complete
MYIDKHKDSFVKKLLIERVNYEYLDVLHLCKQITKVLKIPPRFFENLYEEQEQQQLQESNIKGK